MKTDTKNGCKFAQFIVCNGYYDKNYFSDDYDKFLSYNNQSYSFWEDFEYTMRVEFNKPIKK